MELLEFAGNVALAMLLGSIIGAERQWRQHAAGLRTNALVAVGAALFVSLTRLLGDTNSPSRIASYIVSGVGFLGGGVILKEGANIRGITTAATLWCSAAVGTLSGAGFGLHGAVGVVAILFVVIGLRPVANKLDKLRKAREVLQALYQIRVACESNDVPAVRTALIRHANDHKGMSVVGIVARKKRKHKFMTLLVDIRADNANNNDAQDIVNRLLIEPGVTAASWQRLPLPAE